MDEPSSTSIGSTAPPFCNIVQVPFVLPFTSHSSKSLTYSASNVNSTDNHYNVEIATWPNLRVQNYFDVSSAAKYVHILVLANFKVRKFSF